jgi:hypothetical protein
MRKFVLIGSLTMLLTGCVAPFPPLPGYGVTESGPPQEYYDEPYYDTGPIYVNRPHGRYHDNRAYYGGGRSHYRNDYYPRDDKSRHRKDQKDKDRKDKKDKKDKKDNSDKSDKGKKHKKHHDDD